MAGKMLEKFNKYWGEFDDINGLLYVVVALDPRCKSKYVRYSFSKIYDRATVELLGDKVNDTLSQLYEQYCKSSVSGGPNSSQVVVDTNDNEENDDDMELQDTRAQWDKHVQVEHATDGCPDLERYLQDPLELNCQNFDILAWWKNNSAKYPTLAEIARNVLAIPVSTVASEFAFSTSGRVLNSYRSCLLPSTVQGLVCAQNWL